MTLRERERQGKGPRDRGSEPREGAMEREMQEEAGETHTRGEGDRERGL